jgi:hypothetical protein
LVESKGAIKKYEIQVAQLAGCREISDTPKTNQV